MSKSSLGANLLSAPPQTIEDRGGASNLSASQLPPVLLAGVDTAYISCFVDWGLMGPDLFETFKLGKHNAKSDQGGYIETHTRLGGMIVAPTGSKKADGPYYEFRLSVAGFDIEVRNLDKANAQIPDVVVKCGAVKCLEYGNDFKKIYEAVLDLFHAFGATCNLALPSRVDVFWDIGIAFLTVDAAFRRRDWVCRGRSLDSYGSEIVRKVTHHANGLRPEGFTIGGDLKLRCYDKRFELVGQVDKAVMLEARWKHSGPVSRVEFQLRREPLKARGIITCEDMIEKMDALCAYLVGRWCTFRIGAGEDRRNLKRKAFHPWWDAIRKHSTSLVEPIELVKSEHVRRRDKQWVDQVRGCLLSWAGEKGLEGPEGFVAIIEELTSRLVEDGLTDAADRLRQRSQYRHAQYGRSCIELARVYRAEQTLAFHDQKVSGLEARRWIEEAEWNTPRARVMNARVLTDQEAATLQPKRQVQQQFIGTRDKGEPSL